MARKAIITGGSRGLGAAMVECFARNGFDTVFSYQAQEASARELETRVRAEHGRKCRAFKCDVRDARSAADFVAEAREFLDGLDTLINNAGITRDKTLMMMEEPDWKDVLETNLHGIFNVTHAAVTSLLRQKAGSIINLTSAAALMGLSGQTNYAASKAGIIGFTRALSKECAPRRVTVNAIAPGFIRTDMTAKMPEDYRNSLTGRIPFGRFGDPEEVAEMALFLASDPARYVTGQVFVIDGGLSA